MNYLQFYYHADVNDYPTRLLKGNESAKLNMLSCYISVFYVIFILSFSRCKDTQFFSNHPFVQLLDGEYQVPVATPDDIAAVEGERAELLGVKVFVILRMRMPADIVSHVHRAVGAVAENQPHLQPAKVNSFRYV